MPNDDNDLSLEKRAAIDGFKRLFAEWMKARASISPPGISDEEIEATLKEEDQLAMRVATTPSPVSSGIWKKFQVLEHYLSGEGDGGNWTDNREVIMLAAIKADLMRFGVGRED